VAKQSRRHLRDDAVCYLCGNPILASTTGTGIGRRCFAIEIEPRYVHVAIDRWEAFTGRAAVQASEGVDPPALDLPR